MIKVSTTSEKMPSEYTTDKKYKDLDKSFRKYFGFLPTMTEYYLHFICYIDFCRYYAYDIYSSKVFKVKFEPGYDCDWNDYYLEEVSLDAFKEDVRKHSERYYNLLEGITEENKNELSLIQFGEVEAYKERFVKLETKTGFILTSVTGNKLSHLVEINGKKCLVCDRSIRYAEMDKATYDELFGNCKCLTDVFDVFDKSDSPVWSDQRVMSTRRGLSAEITIDLLKKRKSIDVYRSLCEVYVKGYYIKETITEEQVSGDFLDVIDYIRKHSGIYGNKSYTPIRMIDDEVLESRSIETSKPVNLKDLPDKQEPIKYRNAKKAFKISLTAVFASIVLGCCIPIEIIGFLYFAALGSTVITAILMGIFKE
ncbi:MAG: hypothetical protein E7583_03260 [Ruminococcaceae bacterium]|nr:hypothetical protein [Oscillospiraceae bacterium]